MTEHVLARCDCGKGHWLARLASREAVLGIEVRIRNQGEKPGVIWESLRSLATFIGGSTGATGECPGGYYYRIDTAQLAQRRQRGETALVLHRIKPPAPIDRSKYLKG